jgi:rare lipoprotein A
MRPSEGCVASSILAGRTNSPDCLRVLRALRLPFAAASGVIVAVLSAGCASGPGTSARPAAPPPAPRIETPREPRETRETRDNRDGPEARPPPDLHLVPDAEPRLETPRAGGPNKPYEVLGESYVPERGDPPLVERGLASWYGRKFHGRSTASGETYNMYAMTAAHKTMPIPSYARVRNPANGREVVVRVNDRGPFHRGRVIDLSYTAALKLGVLGGVAQVEVERITYEAIRTGSWKRPSEDTAFAAAPQPAAGSADPVAEIASRVAAEPEPPRAMASSRAPGRAETPVAGVAPGTALADSVAVSAEAPKAAARGFWLQLGAFRQRDAALDLHHRVQREADWLSPLLAIFGERSLHRVQAGPYASRSDANQAAERLRSLLQLVPTIVERR